jgi:hypothetical protein
VVGICAREAGAASFGTDADADGARKDRLRMLNFTLPADPAVRLELATGGFQLIELLSEVEAELPPFRAVFSPHDNPNVGLDVSGFPFRFLPSL